MKTSHIVSDFLLKYVLASFVFSVVFISNAAQVSALSYFDTIKCALVDCSSSATINNPGYQNSYTNQPVSQNNSWFSNFPSLPSFTFGGFTFNAPDTSVNPLPGYTGTNVNSNENSSANIGEVTKPVVSVGDFTKIPETTLNSKTAGCVFSTSVCAALADQGISFKNDGTIAKVAGKDVVTAGKNTQESQSLAGAQMTQSQKQQAQQNNDLISRDNNVSQQDAYRYAPQGYEYVRTVNEDGEEILVDGYAKRNDQAPDLNNLNFKSVCGKENLEPLTPIGASGHPGWNGLGDKIKNDVKLASSAVGKAPRFTSGYRSQAVQDSLCANRTPGRAVACNAAGKGASQHTTGNAIDLSFKGFTNEEKIKFVLIMMSYGYSVINYNPDTHTHFGLDGGQNRWVTNGTVPPPHTRKAFQMTGVSSGLSREVVSSKANNALKTMCN